MKIVSKFQDYYDIGVSMGVDESLVYVRNLEPVLYSNEDIEIDRGSYVDNRKKNRVQHTLKDLIPKRTFFSSSPIEHIHLIGFCGKLYPFVFVDYDKNYQRVSGARFHMSKTVMKELDETYSVSHSSRGFRHETRNDVIKKYNKILGKTFDAPDMFHELKVPVFIIPHDGSRLEKFLNDGVPLRWDTKAGDVVWLNPCLKDFNFYQMVDSFTAFQEISMFITGVLGENKIPPVQISDIHMRDAKGFNERSFKKDPTKKHKRRKNR